MVFYKSVCEVDIKALVCAFPLLKLQKLYIHQIYHGIGTSGGQGIGQFSPNYDFTIKYFSPP